MSGSRTYTRLSSRPPSTGTALNVRGSSIFPQTAETVLLLAIQAITGMSSPSRSLIPEPSLNAWGSPERRQSEGHGLSSVSADFVTTFPKRLQKNRNVEVNTGGFTPPSYRHSISVTLSTPQGSLQRRRTAPLLALPKSWKLPTPGTILALASNDSEISRFKFLATSLCAAPPQCLRTDMIAQCLRFKGLGSPRNPALSRLCHSNTWPLHLPYRSPCINTIIETTYTYVKSFPRTLTYSLLILSARNDMRSCWGRGVSPQILSQCPRGILNDPEWSLRAYQIRLSTCRSASEADRRVLNVGGTVAFARYQVAVLGSHIPHLLLLFSVILSFSPAEV